MDNRVGAQEQLKEKKLDYSMWLLQNAVDYCAMPMTLKKCFKSIENPEQHGARAGLICNQKMNAMFDDLKFVVQLTSFKTLLRMIIQFYKASDLSLFGNNENAQVITVFYGKLGSFFETVF